MRTDTFVTNKQCMLVPHRQTMLRLRPIARAHRLIFKPCCHATPFPNAACAPDAAHSARCRASCPLRCPRGWGAAVRGSFHCCSCGPGSSRLPDVSVVNAFVLETPPYLKVIGQRGACSNARVPERHQLLGRIYCVIQHRCVVGRQQLRCALELALIPTYVCLVHSSSSVVSSVHSRWLAR